MKGVEPGSGPVALPQPLLSAISKMSYTEKDNYDNNR